MLHPRKFRAEFAGLSPFHAAAANIIALPSGLDTVSIFPSEQSHLLVRCFDKSFLQPPRNALRAALGRPRVILY